MYLPEEMELEYYSAYTAKTSAGVWITKPTTTTDTIIIPDTHAHVVAAGASWIIMKQMGPSFANDAKDMRLEFQDALKDLITQYGIKTNSVVTRAFRPAVRWPRRLTR